MMLADLARLGARDIEQTLGSRRIILSSILGSKSASEAFSCEVYASFLCPQNVICPLVMIRPNVLRCFVYLK
jgi:hypothetical protein